MKVLFFAQTRDAAGCSDVEYAGPVTAAAFEEILLHDFPKLIPLWSSIRLARNGAYVERGAVFQQDDEIALIPPVSGG